ncbi:MBL fold metallo-hydrolase [Segetibacter aerophilus]|uniref:Hydrolase n=1 Tax=Segetibacter aerophilus TaxID=670293 RepID=A0A512BDY2_9BACT|nr:MBL fold metallo-hydrolase [Segetibacter aerophilus]GEO10181.1 hydrolase [Segetibacter aerophilus]
MANQSDHFNGKIFLNPVPTEVMGKGSFSRIMKLYLQKHPNRSPSKQLGPFKADSSVLDKLQPDQLRVTWLGHSSTLLEIDGKRFLTDPLWYQRASPFSGIGPKRFFDNPLPINDLPAIDYIVLSHDHFDHLDKHSILHLLSKRIPIITMLGVGKRLVDWGADQSLVTELDWWQSINLPGGFVITALPSRHFSGRWINDRFSTLWGSFAIKGPLHNVYFGADSGYYDGFKKIGDQHGPFDLTMLDTGAYNKEWESIHMGPENAVRAHLDLKGKVLMPIHWGTFNLAFHPWTEPVERVIKAAEIDGVKLLLPTPGETRIVDTNSYNSGWWKRFM